MEWFFRQFLFSMRDATLTREEDLGGHEGLGLISGRGMAIPHKVVKFAQNTEHRLERASSVQSTSDFGGNDSPRGDAWRFCLHRALVHNFPELQDRFAGCPTVGRFSPQSAPGHSMDAGYIRRKTARWGSGIPVTFWSCRDQ